MYSQKFILTTLSDVVVIASSNTEGKIEYLDYIPGSAIRGIAARFWSDYRDPYRLFYSSEVKFLDANPYMEDKTFYPIPLSFHKPKNADIPIYNEYHIPKIEFEKDEYEGFKQIRSGYFSADFSKIDIILEYRQKSARDYERGRSKEGQMFGYAAIPAGMQFYFKICAKNENDLEELSKAVVGEHFIGKSKSAEYARVKIELHEWEDGFGQTKSNDIHYVYAKSRLLLIDNNGNPTYDLTALHPELSKENIKNEHCYIRTGVYAPYNRTRKGYDAQRAFIQKGSVIALKNIDEKILNDIAQGVGAFQNEGFGEVVIDPSFLYIDKKIPLIDLNITYKEEKKESLLVHFLEQKKQKLKKEAHMLYSVNEFIKDKKSIFSNISPSQWGTVRALAKRYKEKALDEIKNFIGKGEKAWSQKQQNILCEFIEKHGYKATIILATEMAKEAK